MNRLSQLYFLAEALHAEMQRDEPSECVLAAIETAQRVINERDRVAMYIELSQGGANV